MSSSNLEYYNVLEIDQKADVDAVKRAYRKMALRWHPDKNPDNKETAERKFKLISEAYEVLSDPAKRKVYDKYGKAGLMPGGGGQGRSSHEGGHRRYYRTSSGNQHENLFFSDMGDLFSNGAFGFVFRDPEEIFREFFGAAGFDIDFDDLNEGRAGGGSGSSHHRRSRKRNGGGGSGGGAGGSVITHNMMFNPFGGGLLGSLGGFGGFGGGALSAFSGLDGGSGGHSFVQSYSSSFGSGGFGGGNGFTSSMTSTTTRIVNGKRVTEKRIVKDGQETVIVEEDGQPVRRSTKQLKY